MIYLCKISKIKSKLIILILFAFITMQDQSRSQSNEKKNRSMLSTQNMSCNQSYATNFYN